MLLFGLLYNLAAEEKEAVGGPVIADPLLLLPEFLEPVLTLRRVPLGCNLLVAQVRKVRFNLAYR